MKKILPILLLVFGFSTLGNAQSKEGSIVIDSIYSEHLENDFGENPTRAVSIYLPPDYHESYYYLAHGGVKSI